MRTKPKENLYPGNESWGRLTSYCLLRCHLRPDGLARVADISCSDARENFDGDADIGRSIVVQNEILHVGLFVL